jgi:hypothetical protein
MYDDDEVSKDNFHAYTPTDATFSKRATTSNSLRTFKSNNLINSLLKQKMMESISPISKKMESKLETPNSMSHCISHSLLKSQKEMTPIKPSKMLKTIGEKLYEMSPEEKNVSVTGENKIYKKSLEHYYFKNKDHPNKKLLESISGRSKYFDSISPSSKKIIKKQMQAQNWSAKKPAAVNLLSTSVVAGSNFPKNTFCQSFINESDFSRFDLASSILDSTNRKGASSIKHNSLLE